MDTTAQILNSPQYRRGEAMMISITDDEIIHYGIPGMKWGVRRSQETLDRLAGRVRTTSKNVKKNVSQRRSERREDRKTVRKANRKAKVDAAKVRARGKVEVEKAKVARKVRETESGSDTKTSTSTPAKGLTDQELKKRVERLNLEKQYKSLTTKPAKRTAADAARDFATAQGKKLMTQAADAMIQRTVSSITNSPSKTKGESALASVVKTPKVSKSKTSVASRLIDSLNTARPAPKPTPSAVALANRHINKNQMKSVSDIISAYRYTGRRRLNKDRKVTNRRRR